MHPHVNAVRVGPVLRYERKFRPSDKSITLAKSDIMLFLCVTKHHAMKMGITPPILNLGIRWSTVFGFTPRLLYPRRKRRRYPLDRKLDGPHSWPGRGGEEKSPCPYRESNPSLPARFLVTILTELPRLPIWYRSKFNVDSDWLDSTSGSAYFVNYLLCTSIRINHIDRLFK
jgi:hypothetical protein